MSSETPLLLTGFGPFGEITANPTARAVRRLARDPRCRALGLKTAVLPVDRDESPARLAALLKRHRPRGLILTGVAAGREEICFERTAVNVWRDVGGRGHGRRIHPGGPDGLFATGPLAASVQALRAGGPARVSESAGTYACNLVLYEALRWTREGTPWGGPAPRWTAFVHVPATPGCGAPAEAPTWSEKALEESLRALCLEWSRRLTT